MYEIDRYRPAERRLMDLMTLMGFDDYGNNVFADGRKTPDWLSLMAADRGARILDADGWHPRWGHATLTVDKVVDRINRSKVVMLGAERDMTKECASALVNFDEDALERLDVAAKTVVWTR